MWDDEYDERMGFERDLDAAYAAFGGDYYGVDNDDEDDEREYYRDLLDELGE